MCRKIFRVETLIQNTLHGLERCRCAGNMPLAGIALNDCMIERATVGGIGIAVEAIKRVELQDTPRVDRIGVTAQPAHFAEGIALRLQVGRRFGGRALCCFLVDGRIHQGCPVAIGLAALLQLFGKILAAECQQSLQPARCDCGCRALSERAAVENLPCPVRHLEIVRQLADAPLRRFQTDGCLHVAGQKRVVCRLARPKPFIETADHDSVDALQSCLKGTENENARMAHGSRLDRFASHQCREDISPLRTIRIQDFAAFHQFAKQAGKLVACLAGPESGKIVVVIRADGFDHPARPLGPIGKRQFVRERPA
ncbi:hypothetical protein D3C80_1158560 [compost metagenome]